MSQTAPGQYNNLLIVNFHYFQQLREAIIRMQCDRSVESALKISTTPMLKKSYSIMTWRCCINVKILELRQSEIIIK